MRNWLMMVAIFAMMYFTGCSNLEKRIPQPAPELVFFYEDVKIPMAVPAAPVLEALGEAESCTEQPSCLFEGMDRTYCYGSFYLTTGPSAQGEQITGLWFADDTVQTPEGIAIGDEAAEILSAYETDTRGDAYICDQGSTRLLILTREGVVTSVQYLMVNG